MVMKVEATHAYEEQMAYQMVQKVPNSRMGGPVALLKVIEPGLCHSSSQQLHSGQVMATRTFEFCAREASQILGGSSYVREGKGQIVERLYREVIHIACCCVHIQSLFLNHSGCGRYVELRYMAVVKKSC